MGVSSQVSSHCVSLVSLAHLVLRIKNTRIKDDPDVSRLFPRAIKVVVVVVFVVLVLIDSTFYRGQFESWG